MAYHHDNADMSHTVTYQDEYDDPAMRDFRMTPGEYVRTRISTLKPPFAPLPNPFRVLRLLKKKHWLNFLLGFAGWTWDAFDFFCVSLTIDDLGETFGKSASQITWGITLVLMLRSIGAIIFGIAADRYGRKWPYIANLVLFIIFELATGFTYTYNEFLAVRALYGIAMGGLYGMAAATALEDCPKEARGIVSGMLQQGYAFGYLLATAFARALVNTTSHGWRPLYWFGACPPVLIIIFRYFMPETDAFIARKKLRKAGDNVGKTFIKEGKEALVKHWLVLCYLVVMMAVFNFLSHGSQDLYPTMLKNQFNFGPNSVTATQVVANAGAMAGGTVVGYLSQSLGRRFSILYGSIIGGALLYPYCFVENPRVIASAFFEQFFVQGVWGVVPIHLMELSPPGFRTFVVGTAYQLGNLASSASSTIEATIGEDFPLAPKETVDAKTGKVKVIDRYNYGKVIAIFLGCVYGALILVALVGPEARGRDLDAQTESDLKRTGGRSDSADGPGQLGDSSDEEKGGVAREVEIVDKDKA